MWYVLNAKDVKGSLEKRLLHRPKHLARLNELIKNGRLLLAGAYPAIDSLDPGNNGFTGSLIIAEFDNINEAHAWVDQEPFLINGIYESVDIKPFRKSLP